MDDRYTARRVARLLRRARQYARVHGQELDDVLLSFAYAKDLDGNEIRISTRDRIESIRLFYELTMPRMVEGGEVDRLLGQDRSLLEDSPNLTSIFGGRE